MCVFIPVPGTAQHDAVHILLLWMSSGPEAPLCSETPPSLRSPPLHSSGEQRSPHGFYSDEYTFVNMIFNHLVPLLQSIGLRVHLDPEHGPQSC